MQQQTDNFSSLESFQEKLCQLMLQDRPFCDQITEVLDIEFLETKYLVVTVILDYRQRYGVHPSYEILATIFKSGISEYDAAVQKQVRDITLASYHHLWSMALNTLKTQQWFLSQASSKASDDEVRGLLKSSSFDEISKVINDALKLGSDNNFGHDWMADFGSRFQIKARNPITTGWERMDGFCKGGLGKSELGVVIAPTGAGKSMVLVHLGSQALKEGKTVVHYTLELADTVVGQRYDSCITGIPLNDLMMNKAEIFDQISDIEGNLIVKEYPTKSATTQSIRITWINSRKTSIQTW